MTIDDAGLTRQRTRYGFGCQRCGAVTPPPADDAAPTEYVDVPEGVDVGATREALEAAFAETAPAKGQAHAKRGRVGWCVTCAAALLEGME